jgi:predicted SAM-dependent methyltransferase
MKIEIGAGTKPTPGYVHVDAVMLDEVDVVDDGRTLSKFEDGVAEEIYSHWFLEHVARHEVPPMLARWKQVLAPGGRLRVVTNNHEAHNRCLAEGEISFEEWSYLIYAVENKRGYSEWDIHKCAWSRDLLRSTLERSGFVEVDVDAQWRCREEDGRLKCPALIASAVKPKAPSA